mgnify:CR=1 FL=1
MALAMLAPGQSAVIQDIRGKEEVKRHLQNLGFVKGETVQILSENSSGLILLIKEVRIALNRSLALKILVA